MNTKVKTRATRFTIKPSTKGQIVIPKEIRDYFGITENTRLVFTFDENQVMFTKQNNDIDETFGFLGRKIKNAKNISQEQFEKDLENAKNLTFKSSSNG